MQQRVAIIRDQALHLDIPGYDSATLNEDQIAEFAEMLRENISRYKGDAQRIRVTIYFSAAILFNTDALFDRMLERRPMKRSTARSTNSIVR